MAYGTIKVDTITFTNAGIDKSVTISGLVQNPTFTGNVTVTGTVSGATANFVSGVFTTQISGATVTGGNANFTSGTFTNISGGVYTITSGVFALGTSGTPSISFASDPNTGIYSPGADQVAISTSGTGRLIVGSTGTVNIVGAGTAGSTQAVSFNGSAPVDSLVMLADGKVGLGTSSPTTNYKLDVAGALLSSSNSSEIAIVNRATNAAEWAFYSQNGEFNIYQWSAAASRLVIDTSGRVGIGTTSPEQSLSIVAPSTAQAIGVWNRASDNIYGGIYFKTNNGATDQSSILNERAGTNGASLLFYTKPDGGSTTERARIDSSGRLLVGTSTGPASSTLVLQGNSDNASFNSVLRMLRNVTDPAANTVLGTVAFGTSGKDSAFIEAYSDAQWGANDYPGRLVFSVTADGASSPTERMRIAQNGIMAVGKTSGLGSIDTAGAELGPDGYIICSRALASASVDSVVYVNRQTTDGDLIQFFQANAQEGAISVSGTTVTYGGGHLARWSQLPNEENPSGILKGTVMSNLDEMCEWGEEDNEQLNKTKVSDVEGDPNVAGVFVSTSFSDDGPLDFFVAMTGDMIIRIAEGVTVQRGDLLMSAGDGTAKPQDDDIIRSKTIAKVTSNYVTCTYDDGSYCVPCVLMAC
jgi:hypothetical protein